MLWQAAFPSVRPSRTRKEKEMLSTHITHVLKALMLAFVVAAMVVPVVQAEPAPAGKYGPLDPWAYSLVHQSLQSGPLITGDSAGQNRPGQVSTAGKYGPLDPSIAAAIQSHSRPQSGVSKAAAPFVRGGASSGFDWGAAGIGASIAFAAMLLTLGLARVAMRRGRARLAGL
jgi:hypothetical protein